MAPATVTYRHVAEAIAPTGMLARGGFVVGPHDTVPTLKSGEPTRAVVVVGNVGSAIWRRFSNERTPGRDPLDRWTRSVLAPIADRFDADLIHPNDEPFQPIQRWAMRADDVWPSPLGLLIHPEFGLWHAYRGALLFAVAVDGLPHVGTRSSPCEQCETRPCLTTCPVEAFVPGQPYAADRCRDHVRSDTAPHCRSGGCAARRACPVNATGFYEVEQMEFHMAAFVGDSSW